MRFNSADISVTGSCADEQSTIYAAIVSQLILNSLMNYAAFSEAVLIGATDSYGIEITMIYS